MTGVAKKQTSALWSKQIKLSVQRPPGVSCSCLHNVVPLSLFPHYRDRELRPANKKTLTQRKGRAPSPSRDQGGLGGGGVGVLGWVGGVPHDNDT